MPIRPMMRKRTGRGLATALVVAASLGAAGSPVAAQEWRDFRAARQAGSIETLEVELLYGAGRLSIGPSEAPFLYDAHIRYDTDRFQPVRGWTEEDGHGRLRLAMKSIGDDRDDATIRLEDWDDDFDLDRLRRTGDAAGTLDFELHPGIPTALRIGIGAAASRLGLGDLSLTTLEVLTGASKTELVFDRPNRVRMSNLTLHAGAAQFEAEGLGNARFDHLEFHGAIGDVTLDFSGAWERSATAEIKMGLGGLKIRVPRGIGVRIERSSLLMALNAEGFAKNGNSYVSPNWDTAEIRLDIELEAALGAVEVERI